MKPTANTNPADAITCYCLPTPAMSGVLFLTSFLSHIHPLKQPTQSRPLIKAMLLLVTHPESLVKSNFIPSSVSYVQSLTHSVRSELLTRPWPHGWHVKLSTLMWLAGQLLHDFSLVVLFVTIICPASQLWQLKTNRISNSRSSHIRRLRLN